MLRSQVEASTTSLVKIMFSSWPQSVLVCQAEQSQPVAASRSQVLAVILTTIVWSAAPLSTAVMARLSLVQVHFDKMTRSSSRRSIRAVAPHTVSPSTSKNHTGKVPSGKSHTSSW